MLLLALCLCLCAGTRHAKERSAHPAGTATDASSRQLRMARSTGTLADSICMADCVVLACLSACHKQTLHGSSLQRMPSEGSGSPEQPEKGNVVSATLRGRLQQSVPLASGLPVPGKAPKFHHEPALTEDLAVAAVLMCWIIVVHGPVVVQSHSVAVCISISMPCQHRSVQPAYPRICKLCLSGMCCYPGNDGHQLLAASQSWEADTGRCTVFPRQTRSSVIGIHALCQWHVLLARRTGTM